jgi:hypothetical protein
MSIAHRLLDRSTRPTYVYERAAGLLVELLLLAGCAAVSVTGWRSGLAAGVVAALRLYDYELRRADSSVATRQREAGAVGPLPEHKRAAAAARARASAIVAWTWPGLTMFVGAAEARTVSAAMLAGLGATLIRVAWGTRVMPAWRRSRVAWRAR